MKYVSPEPKTETEINAVLSDDEASEDQRIHAVLSALYYGSSIEFSGDVLIKEFSKASGQCKRDLAQQFETFYGLCRTNYRASDSVKLLEEYKFEAPEHLAEIDEIISAVREFCEIFGRSQV